MSTPETAIHVCSGVLLTNDYNHTIWFDNVIDQKNYFMGKVVKTFPAYSYLRKNWSIKVEADMGQARTWNYLFFNQNAKTWYYFITNIQYINDVTVELQLEMDVMQTYLHEYTLHPCFVEREHAATDDIGDNVIDEGLELGELVINTSSNMDIQEMCVLILSSADIATSLGEEFDASKKYDDVWGSVLDGATYSGLNVYAVRFSDLNVLPMLYQHMGSKSEAIMTMWMYPRKLIELSQAVNPSPIEKVLQNRTVDMTYTRPDTVDGYTPRNKKLLTYPYNMMYVTNNMGDAAVYHYELFDSVYTSPHECKLRVCGSVTPNATVKVVPINYRGVIINYDEGLMSGNYPTCAWNQDTYKMWLAQNQNQHALTLAAGGLQIAGGVAAMAGAFGTGGLTAPAGVGLIASGASSIAGVLAQHGDMAVQPNQSKGTQSSSLNIAHEHQTFTVQNKSVSAERAALLDDYFSMYGYKTLRVKVPNRNVRTKYTYTKTIGCLVTGNICTEDLRKIQSIYDNGVTFWADGDKIGNYFTERWVNNMYEKVWVNDCKGGA